MKFELLPPNKQFSDSDLIKDLQKVSKQLNKNSATIKDYQIYGQFSYQTLKKRFGSWGKALEAAGLKGSKRPWGGELSETRIPENELIEDMQIVAQKLEKKGITIAEYDKHGKYGSATICKRYGGWNKAKKHAGLEIGRLYKASDEDYFENILQVWQHLGRQPKYHEMIAPLSRLNKSSYERKYGTWRAALEKFIDYVNSKDDIVEVATPLRIQPNEKKAQHKTANSEKVIQKHRTNRTANLRQRFRVMKRDGFKCVLCGASPTMNLGCELHVDHVIPWSGGGETIEENLRTLCSDCNLGRSNQE